MTEIVNVNPKGIDLDKIVSRAFGVTGLLKLSFEGLTEDEVALAALCISLTDSVGGLKELRSGYYPKEQDWYDRLTGSRVFQDLSLKVVGQMKKESKS